ncbi:hypothetical protein [Arabiibacter massiliensis]|uniref:hypothetical protein n=1 Tax=Arabiibacter massiliensis TaxID=1870985 RepID=UPI0009B9D52C|nr:hypothetical protein [Arabiibacter massiliensis]
MGEKDIFRRESLEQDTGAEQLTGYLRTSSPAAWMALAAVAVMAACLWVWGVWGVIERDVTTLAVVKDGVAVMYVTSMDAGDVQEGMTVRLGDDDADQVDSAGVSGTIEAVGRTFDVAPDSDVPKLLVDSQIGPGDRYCEVTARLDVADGAYPASIVTETIQPISLLFR